MEHSIFSKPFFFNEKRTCREIWCLYLLVSFMSSHQQSLVMTLPSTTSWLPPYSNCSKMHSEKLLASICRCWIIFYHGLFSSAKRCSFIAVLPHLVTYSPTMSRGNYIIKEYNINAVVLRQRDLRVLPSQSLLVSTKPVFPSQPSLSPKINLPLLL